jgi:processive 1,2-diacylglycerol beta-glucosyltransferase
LYIQVPWRRLNVTFGVLFRAYSQVIHRAEGFSLQSVKKILLLTATLGKEEDVASRNLRETLEHLAGREARIEVINLFDIGSGGFGALVHDALPFAMKRRSAGGDLLRDLLRGFEPDVVVAASSIYGSLLDEIYQGGRARDFTLIGLVTERVLDDSPWTDACADFFAVTNERAAGELAASGINAEKIKVLGFPLQLQVRAELREIVHPERDGNPRILYLINNARKKAPKVLDRMLEQTEWNVTVCIENDIGLEEMAREKAATAPERLEVFGHTRNLPQLLRRHDVVISRASTVIVQEAIAARCPLIAPKVGSPAEEANLAMLKRANAGVLAEKPREIIDWLERAFRDEGSLLALWRKNLEPLGVDGGGQNLARFILEQAAENESAPGLRALPAPPRNGESAGKSSPVIRLRSLPKKLLLCDLHTHTTWSDGKLTISELVDFYGQRGFDCLCVTDHLCDPNRLLGKLVNLTGLVIPPDDIAGYFDAIEREKKRAWAKYDLMLMAGVEFNKDGYTAKTSTHLLGVDLKQPIDPSLEIKELIREIHAQGALAIASHPHEMKSQWGRDTLYLWEHVDEYAPLIDAWEVANRDDIFNPVGLKKLPFIASSDFHKPKHIHSWKTLLYCEKEAEAIKHCIRVNRDVSLTLYRDHRFGLEERELPALEESESRLQAARI